MENARRALGNELYLLEHDKAYTVLKTLRDTEIQRTELVKTPQGKRAIRKVFKNDLSHADEYEALAHLTEPLLPSVLDSYSLSGSQVVVLEYLEGITLRTMVEQYGTPEKAVLLSYMADLCTAVTALHAIPSHPLIHRDINPSNIICANGTARLIDFGIARSFKAESSHDTTTLGTVGYAPPEQFGFGQSTPQTDVYALGMVFYFMLAGKDPTPDIAQTIENDRSVPLSYRAIISKCAALEKNRRYKNALELIEAIESAHGYEMYGNIPDPDASVDSKGALEAEDVDETVVEHEERASGLPPLPHNDKAGENDDAAAATEDNTEEPHGIPETTPREQIGADTAHHDSQEAVTRERVTEQPTPPVASTEKPSTQEPMRKPAVPQNPASGESDGKTPALNSGTVVKTAAPKTRRPHRHATADLPAAQEAQTAPEAAPRQASKGFTVAKRILWYLWCALLTLLLGLILIGVTGAQTAIAPTLTQRDASLNAAAYASLTVFWAFIPYLLLTNIFHLLDHIRFFKRNRIVKIVICTLISVLFGLFLTALFVMGMTPEYLASLGKD